MAGLETHDSARDIEARILAALLNRLTGLDEWIEVHEGSALDMPFPDASFDVV